MRLRNTSFILAAAMSFAMSLFTGCESTDSGSAPTTTVYYGAVFSDPWYHGDYDDDYNVIVTPPPSSGNRPPGTGGGGDSSVRPEHPIANPPGGSQRPPSASQLPASRPPSASTRPAPSIPSTPRATPRAAPRGGGGRR